MKSKLELRTDIMLTNILANIDVAHPDNYEDILSFIVKELKEQKVQDPNREDMGKAILKLLETFKK